MKKIFAKVVTEKVNTMKRLFNEGKLDSGSHVRVEIVGLLDLAKELGIISRDTKFYLYRKLYEI